MIIADQWKDYELIDMANGEKLERWGKYILRRPDPQVIWDSNNKAIWNKADAIYHRSRSGGGSWEFKRQLPERWQISYGNLKFNIEPTGFKHTGLFPEQAVNWDWMIDKIKSRGTQTKVLNLFAYTGGATVACTSAGAEVCHVDAAKGIVTWAKENMEASGLAKRPVRYIVDDCIKFVKREIRRGRKYDAVIMDPPSYGRGPGGEMWKIEDSLFEMVQLCAQVLSDKPLFFLMNSYTTGLSPTVLNNILNIAMKPLYKGKIYSGEVGLRATSSGLILPCGIYGRWEN